MIVADTKFGFRCLSLHLTFEQSGLVGLSALGEADTESNIFNCRRATTTMVKGNTHISIGLSVRAH